MKLILHLGTGKFYSPSNCLSHMYVCVCITLPHICIVCIYVYTIYIFLICYLKFLVELLFWETVILVFFVTINIMEKNILKPRISQRNHLTCSSFIIDLLDSFPRGQWLWCWNHGKVSGAPSPSMRLRHSPLWQCPFSTPESFCSPRCSFSPFN